MTRTMSLPSSARIWSSDAIAAASSSIVAGPSGRDGVADGSETVCKLEVGNELGADDNRAMTLEYNHGPENEPGTMTKVV